ncbi:MAG: glycosyl transferase family 2 MxdB [Nitrospirales bacterium]|nr:MAG: glycosyl transferase family 2 MxdB [Nitrospirales bacterium]
MEVIVIELQRFFIDFDDGLHEILHSGLPHLIGLFWPFFLIELNRYLFVDVYVLCKSFQKQVCEPFPCPTKPPPQVSVIMSVLNEGGTIEASVRSLQEQDYPNIEIIVVDDGSTDHTLDICRKLAAEGAIRLFPMENRQGKSGALTYGCRVARGDYLVFMDSDSSLDRRAIRHILQPFQDENVGAVGGNVGVRNLYTNLLTRLQGFEYLCGITVGRQFRAGMGILGIVSGAFGAFRRSLVERVGWHEPGPGNDSDLTIRIRKMGKQVAFAPKAICLTNAPLTWEKWVRQRLRWNRNIIRNRIRKHRDTFNIYSDHFNVQNIVSFLDTLAFSVGLAGIWLVYMIQLMLFEHHNYIVIFVINLIMFSAAKFLQILIALQVSGRFASDWRLISVIPGMVLYRIIEKIVRIVACVQEIFFRTSYHDPFAPEKVRQQVPLH